MSDASIEDLQTFFLLFQKLSSSDFANLDAYKQGDKMASGSNQMISLDPQSNAAKVARALSPINDQSDVSKDTAMRDELLKVLKLGLHFTYSELSLRCYRHSLGFTRSLELSTS